VNPNFNGAAAATQFTVSGIDRDSVRGNGGGDGGHGNGDRHGGGDDHGGGESNGGGHGHGHG
jgi:hypothetical protein